MEYSKYFRFLWILAVAFAGSTGQADNKIKQKSSSSSSDLLAYGYSSYNRADQGGFSYFDEDRQRRGRFSGRGSRRGPYDHLRSRRKSYYEGGLDFDSTLRRTRRKPLARDVFHIKSTISRKCLDVSRSSHFIGERLHLWSCHGHANQKFRYDRRTKQIRMTHARGLCFEVRGNRVVQARCSQWRNDAQQFVYDPKFDLIINPNNRLCLELAHLRHEGSELRANRCNLHKMTQKFQIQEGYGGSSFGRGYNQRQRNSWGRNQNNYRNRSNKGSGNQWGRRRGSQNNRYRQGRRKGRYQGGSRNNRRRYNYRQRRQRQHRNHQSQHNW